MNMSIKRYMLRLSYLGTHYRGSQKQSKAPVVDLDSVQGAVESSLNFLRSRVQLEPQIVFAGRTDSGVHALYTAAHLDIKYKPGLQPIDTNDMIQLMNRYLVDCHHEIRILSCHEVSPNFHARYSAKKRQYLYRFIVAKDANNNQVPAAEFNRTFFVRQNRKKFDIELMKRAIPLFCGTKDFTTFSAFAKNRMQRETVKSNVRTLDVKLEKGEPQMSFDPLSHKFDYYHLIFTSRGFLYNQVRRIVGALVAAGMSTITEEDIITMLQVPSHNMWCPRIRIVPAQGLYLLNVEYDESDTREVL